MQLPALAMEFHEPSTEEKSVFFAELEALGALSEADDDDFEHVLTTEAGDRQRWRQALETCNKSEKQASKDPISSLPMDPRISGRGSEIDERAASLGIDTEDSVHPPLKAARPRRVLSDPGRATSIAAPPAEAAGLAQTFDGASSPHPATQSLRHIERSLSALDHPTELELLQGLQEFEAATGPGKGKKRAQAQNRIISTMFAGLLFYFLPDNSKNPLRRGRIRAVLERSGRWTRKLDEASYIIVDDHLNWSHIANFVQPRIDCSKVLIKYGQFISDCIRYKYQVNPHQKQYDIKGRPSIEPPLAEPSGPSSSVASEESLKLKPAQRDPRKWDYVPPPSTPSNSEGASQINSAHLDAEQQQQQGSSSSASSSEGPEKVLQRHASATSQDNSIEAKFDDALSECIAYMRVASDLPLDDDDDGMPSNADEAVDGSDSEAGSDGERAQKRQKTEKQGRKTIAWEDRFACNKGGTLDENTDCPNARTIEMLERLREHYARTNEHWRNHSYRKAIATLKTIPYKVTTAQEAQGIVNIGSSIAQKIEEIHTTDRLKRLEFAEQEPSDLVLKTFLRIYGVGTAQANQWIAKGYRTLEDLRQSAKLTTNQKIGIDHYDDLNTRIPRREVEALGSYVKSAAAKIDAGIELIIGGSYRRGSPDSGDIDFIVTKKGTSSSEQLIGFLHTLVHVLETEGFLVARLAASSKGEGSKWHGCCVLPEAEGSKDENYKPVWRRIDFLVVPESEMGAALIYFTGNDIFNRSIRLLASKKGMRLNQRGLYRDVMRGPARVKLTEGELLESRDERRIFEILGVKWREPHERWCGT